MERPLTTGRDLDRVEGSVTYRVAGPAGSLHPPVVFVHGLLVDGALWAGVADVLAGRGIRSYAPNWPLGSHRVPMNADADLSPRGVAAIINEFLAALDLTDVTLVGNDTGGALCQFTIDTDHSRVGRLVLTNCDAFDVFPPGEFAGLLKVGRHAPLVKLLALALRPTAVRHSRHASTAWCSPAGRIRTRPADGSSPRSWTGRSAATPRS